MAGPQQFGGTTLNIWTMLRSLVFSKVGILVNAGAPTNGVSGTYAGQAGPGSIIIDTVAGNLYQNIGTVTSPIWLNIGTGVVGNGGLGNDNVAKFTYDFAVDGGVQGAIIPANSPTIPIKAIILGGVIDITTTLTSLGSATIALGTSAGSSANSLKTATAVATWAAGVTVPLIPVFTAATFLKMTAAGRPNLTIAVADLTAGKFDVSLLYVMGN